MEADQISLLATLLRTHNQPHSSVFSISDKLLASILSALDNVDPENSSTSFHVHQSGAIFKTEMIRDLHFLSNFIHNVQSLKIYSDVDTTPVLDLSKFANLKSLELSKIDVNCTRNLQKLRSQIQKITCNKTLNTLEEVLSDCGGDKSALNCWSNLREANFVNNELVELDSSLEWAPCLQTVDLSRNHLTSIEIVNCLTNLKHLNVSYNRLESICQFRGQICSRLQNLTLKGNFIEDTYGLQSLMNVCLLDLSNNCLVDHNTLICLSHMATLQCLNLSGNPLSFHPNHRTKTASYLHVNTESTRFVLDDVALSKNEKKLIGTLHPMQSRNLSGWAYESVNLSASEKIRKIRHVTIEEQSSVPKATVSPVPTPSRSHIRQHLETRREIEDLRRQLGDDWLKFNDGKSIDDVLGLEKSELPVSSSPYDADFLIHSGTHRQVDSLKSDGDPKMDENDRTEGSFVTAFETTTDSTQEEEEEEVDDSDDDTNLEGEEGIFIATPKGETDEIILVITRNHITESGSATSRERAKWDLDTITSCRLLEGDDNSVQLDFETLRKDKKQRVYIFPSDDVDKFVKTINEKIESLPGKELTEYQCMPCSIHFSRVRKESVLSEPVINCPNCGGTLVVEIGS